MSWVDRFPKPEPKQEKPEAPLADCSAEQREAYSKAVDKYNVFIRANRRFIVARNLDELAALEGETRIVGRVETIVQILAMDWLEGSEDPIASMFKAFR